MSNNECLKNVADVVLFILFFIFTFANKVRD